MPNFAKAYLEYASSRTNAPEAFHRFAAVLICAAALGNRLYLDAGWGRIYPSMWVCFIGRSGVGKTTAVNLAASLLQRADATFELPHDFTREAFYEQMQERPYGLLRWREMGSVLKSLKRDYNSGTIETLTDFWDSPHIVKRRTKGAGEITIQRPALSILGAAKPRWFVESTTREDIEGGFLSRWLFVSADANNGAGKFFGQPSTRAEGVQRDSLIDHLRSLTELRPQNGVDAFEMMPGEGSYVLEAWLKDFEATWGDDEEKDPADFAQRAGTQVVKLAMGIQACRGPHELAELHPKAIEQGIQLFEYSLVHGLQLVEQILGRRWEAPEVERVRAVIRGAGEIQKRALMRKTRMKAKLMAECIDTLIDSGEIEGHWGDPTGGRKALIYRWLG